VRLAGESIEDWERERDVSSFDADTAERLTAERLDGDDKEERAVDD
jgi:hypothetical protein